MRQMLTLYLKLVQREVASRYRGTALGFGWSLVTPLLLLAVYSFVFSVVFKTRWPMMAEQGQGQVNFALILFVGLMLHGLAAEAFSGAVTSISSRPNYVKKVQFPIAILPLVPLGNGLVHLGFSLLILLAAILYFQGIVALSALWLPIILLPYLIFLAGTGWFLAALGVYLRDIGQVIGLILTLLLFLSPIFYPPELLPEAYRPWLMLNPLTLIIEQARGVLLWGQAPNLTALGLYSSGMSLYALAGFGFFHRVKRGFADVL